MLLEAFQAGDAVALVFVVDIGMLEHRLINLHAPLPLLWDEPKTPPMGCHSNANGLPSQPC